MIKTILSIETSCDDTGIAIVKTPTKSGGNFSVLADVIASQIKIHAKYGGVYPTLARREHQSNLVPVLEKALREANMLNPENPTNKKFGKIEKNLEREPELKEKVVTFLSQYSKPKIDAIAVTVGPGLEPCLWVGVNFAKALSSYWNIPTIAVNHIKAHLLMGATQNGKTSKLRKNDFPAVCLIVSGGHTQLILMKSVGSYQILGETRDDAAGECLDKAARILGLSYPGGPIIAEQAIGAKNTFGIKLPRPMLNTKDYDFSFSGLKTAVLYENLKMAKTTKKNKEYIKEMCAEIQQAVIDVLIKKTLKAVKDCRAKTIIFGGGVMANKELRKQFQGEIKTQIPSAKCLMPSPEFCTDNGLMVAIAGYFVAEQKKLITPKTGHKNLEVNANLRVQ